MQHCCPVTGKVLEESAMLRLVCAPDGTVVADLSASLPGKSIWIEADGTTLLQSLPALQQAFGLETTLPELLAAQIETGLVKRIQNTIALARRSSAAIAGFAKVEALLKTGKANLLIEAADAGEADKNKLEKLASYHHIPMVRGLTRTELGIPMGKEASVHVVVRNPALAAEIIKEMRRLAGFRKKDAL